MVWQAINSFLLSFPWYHLTNIYAKSFYIAFTARALIINSMYFTAKCFSKAVYPRAEKHNLNFQRWLLHYTKKEKVWHKCYQAIFHLNNYTFLPKKSSYLKWWNLKYHCKGKLTLCLALQFRYLYQNHKTLWIKLIISGYLDIMKLKRQSRVNKMKTTLMTPALGMTTKKQCKSQNKKATEEFSLFSSYPRLMRCRRFLTHWVYVLPHKLKEIKPEFL
jgi:hypothetical protein